MHIGRERSNKILVTAGNPENWQQNLIIAPILYENPWNRMDYKYWLVYIILIAIVLYALITLQWMMGVIACVIVIALALILSQVQNWGKPHA